MGRIIYRDFFLGKAVKYTGKKVMTILIHTEYNKILKIVVPKPPYINF